MTATTEWTHYIEQRSSSGQKTLSGEYYNSEELFRQETERIFAERWILAGRVSELGAPGSYFLRTVGNESIIILRDSKNEIRAFYNVCRHRGTAMCVQSEGKFQGSIQCPYHQWTYGLDGRLIGAPHMQGVEGFSMSEYPLHPVAVAVWEGFIFYNLSRNPQPFKEAFGPIFNFCKPWQLSELQVARRMVYDMKANWKLMFQNYSECYHCTALHPLLNKMTPYRNSINFLEEGSILGGPMMLAEDAASATSDGRLCAQPFAGLSEQDSRRVYYFTLFPTAFLSLAPDYALVHRLERVSVTQTRIVCEWMFHPDEMAKPGFDCGRAVDFWNITNAQDWQVCELSQQGTSSRSYVPGPYANLESMIAAFDRNYLHSLGR
jgi:Rieske 2Fe-2S family protein